MTVRQVSNTKNPVQIVEDYLFHNLDDTTTALTTYIGTQNSSGVYRVKKLVESTTSNMSYATLNNNPTKSTYALAWADRVNLVYERVDGS